MSCRPLLPASALLALVAAAGPAQDRTAPWREDLAFLAKEFPARHKNPFTVIAREEFEKRVATLDGRLADLDDLQAEGGLAELVAAIGDTHSAVGVKSFYEGDPLPLVLWWFADGLRVMRAPKDLERLCGAEVLKVGGHDLEEVSRRLARVTPWDNDSYRRLQVSQKIVFPKLLRYLGLAAETAEVPVTFRLDGGAEETIGIRPAPRTPDLARVKPARAPVTAQRGQAWHDLTFLEEEGLLYVQYNRCATGREHDLDAFTSRLIGHCESGKVKTLVFDLQYNGGGSSLLGDAMFARLAAHAPMKDRKGVYGIIGRGTFSSAILNAMTLKKTYRAALAGEPSGGSPNHFGEVRTFDLPRSGLKVQYSTKRFEHGPPGATTIEPDLPAPVTFADFMAGRDASLDLIRARESSGTVPEQIPADSGRKDGAAPGRTPDEPGRK